MKEGEQDAQGSRVEGYELETVGLICTSFYSWIVVVLTDNLPVFPTFYHEFIVKNIISIKYFLKKPVCQRYDSYY